MRLAAEKISFSYGGSSVLEEISFELCSGQVLCVLGPNGAGKSTLIKCLANIHPPTSGRITIDSVDIKNEAFYFCQSLFEIFVHLSKYKKKLKNGPIVIFNTISDQTIHFRIFGFIYKQL